MFGRKNITRDIPESDFVKKEFGIELESQLLVGEIGCGIASIILSLNVNEKVGLDISYVNLTLAKQRNPEGLMLVQADAEYIPFRTGVFGAIIIVDLLHHVPSPQCVLKETARILESKGKLFVYDMCIDGLTPIFPLAMLTQMFIQKWEMELNTLVQA
jgi:ubiquinone/menaquinone biosynthesis C-methylase UbiE